MKYFYFLLLFWCLHPLGAQPVIHTVLMVDTSDPALAPGRLENLRRIQAELDTIAQFTAMKRQDYLLEGGQLQRAAVERTLAQIKPGDKDVVFVYFSGNEYIAKVPGAHGHLLQLNDLYIEFSELCERLKSRQARLLIVLADLCNQSSAQALTANMQAARKEKYVELFLKSAGEISAVNHFPREQSGLGVSAGGSIFTNAFLEALHEYRPQQLQWSSVSSAAKYLTVIHSQGKQNPQIKIAVSKPGEVQPAESEATYYAPVVPPVDYSGNKGSSHITPDKPKTAAKGGNFIKKEDVFSKQLNTEQLNSYQQESLAKVSLLQEKLVRIASGSSSNSEEGGKSEAELIETSMLLFSDNNREIEISHPYRTKARAKVKKYFSKLYGMSNRFRMQISWYQPTEIEEFKPQADGSYKATATVYQEFRKTTTTGKLIYGDRSVKKIDIVLRPVDNQWKVVIGDILVVEGSTTAISE